MDYSNFSINFRDGNAHGKSINSLFKNNISELSGFYNLQKESVIVMKFIQGENPFEFWLSFYSEGELKSHLAELRKKIQLGLLPHVEVTPTVGKCIVGVGSNVFRGCILSVYREKIVALDIDSGTQRFVDKQNLWELEDSLFHCAPRAILCKLNLVSSCEGWNTYLATVFKNCMSNCNLIVTIKEIIPAVIPVFEVDVNAIDTTLSFNVNEWITKHVIPTIRNACNVFDIGDDVIFKDIDPYFLYKENSTHSDVFPQESVSELFSNIAKGLDNHGFNYETDKGSVSHSSLVEKNVWRESFESLSNFDKTKSNLQDQVKNYSQEHFNEGQDQQINEREALLKLGDQILNPAFIQCFMEKGTILELLFGEGNDPWNFILYHRSLERIWKIKEDLADRAKKGLLTPFPILPSVGDFVVANYGTEFCRTRVLDVSSENDETNILVIDVDSGKMKLLALCDIWFLDEIHCSLPAMAVICSIWNIPNDPFYWNIDLRNLFVQVMANGPFIVVVKDVKFSMGFWKHIVEIEICLNHVFNVSEWVTLALYSSIRKIRELSVTQQSTDDVISNLHPAIFFSDKSKIRNISYFSMNSHDTDGKENEEKKHCFIGFNSSVFSPSFLTNAVKIIDMSTAERSCFQYAYRNYNSKFMSSKICSKPPWNEGCFHFKKCELFIEPGRKYFVFLAGIVSPKEFYVHIISSESAEIEEMNKKLQNNCETENVFFQSKKDAQDTLLHCCVVLYESRWCRAKILNWLGQSYEGVFVFLVDYGIYTVVSFQSIQCLRWDLFKYPEFAQKCSLANILPPAGNNMWPKNSLEGFWSALHYYKLYEIKIVGFNGFEESLNVYLYPEIGVENSINNYLIAKGLAIQPRSKIGNKSKVAELNIQPKNEPEWTIISFEYAGEKEPCETSTITIESIFDNNIIFPSVGEVLSVVILNFINTLSFYSIPAKSTYNGNECNTLYILNEMNRNITSAAESDLLKPVDQFDYGSIVVARGNDDGMWRRGRVLADVNSMGYVKIFFVDFGAIDYVHRKFIKEITDEFCDLRFQAQQFYIGNITKFKCQCAQKKVFKILNDLCQKDGITIKIIEIKYKFIIVHVYSEGIDVNTKLQHYICDCEIYD